MHNMHSAHIRDKAVRDASLRTHLLDIFPKNRESVIIAAQISEKSMECTSQYIRE